MYEITVPKPIKITLGDKVAPYTLPNFVAEFVLRDKRWRDEWAPSFASICEAFDGSKKGVVRLIDDDFDKIKSLAKSFELPPAQSHIYLSLMPFVHAITQAKHLDGGDKKKPGVAKAKG